MPADANFRSIAAPTVASKPRQTHRCRPGGDFGQIAKVEAVEEVAGLGNTARVKANGELSKGIQIGVKVAYSGDNGTGIGPKRILKGTFSSSLGIFHWMMSAFSPVNSLKMFDGLESSGIFSPKPPLPAPLAAPVKRPSKDLVLAAQLFPRPQLC